MFLSCWLFEGLRYPVSNRSQSDPDSTKYGQVLRWLKLFVSCQKDPTLVLTVSHWWGGSHCDYSRSYKILSFPDPAAWNFNPNLMKNYPAHFGFEKRWDMAPYCNDGYYQVRRAASPPSATPTPVSPKVEEHLEREDAKELSGCSEGPASGSSTTLPLTSGMRNDKNDPMLRPSDVDKLTAEVKEEVKDIGMGLGHVGTSTSLNMLYHFWTIFKRWMLM